MAETLQPGQCKLPSAQELTLMAQLVAQPKGESLAGDPANPANPGAPSCPQALPWKA